MLTRRVDSPWGGLWLVAEDSRLQGVYFEDSNDLSGALGQGWHQGAGATAEWPADRWVLDASEQQLAEYAAGTRHSFDLPLLERGTPFQQRIWAALARVPFGQTVSYGSLASLAGRPSAARAVGNAVGGNPWVIVVPCHRVLAAGGKLGGFSSGLDRKRELLRLEGISWRE
jgi:methylated-DNA-[protein]-cysteine S-methyltransferase